MRQSRSSRSKISSFGKAESEKIRADADRQIGVRDAIAHGPFVHDKRAGVGKTEMPRDSRSLLTFVEIRFAHGKTVGLDDGIYRLTRLHDERTINAARQEDAIWHIAAHRLMARSIEKFVEFVDCVIHRALRYPIAGD